MHHLLLALGALVPMGSVALLFVYVMRAVLRADRDERAALAAYDAQAVIDAVEAPAPQPRTGAPEGVVVGDVVSRVDAPVGPPPASRRPPEG